MNSRNKKYCSNNFINDEFSHLNIYFWLYTNGINVTEDKCKLLKNNGINEIRFDLAATNYSNNNLNIIYNDCGSLSKNFQGQGFNYQREYYNANGNFDNWETYLEKNDLVREMKIFLIINRGVAQLVECLVWDQDVVGSSPATPTKMPE